MASENQTPILVFDSKFLSQLERLAILSRQMAAGQMQGERRSTKRGQSVEFADYRPYTLGDDFRRIDWNAYARLEKFFIKLFVEEEDLTVHILIDSSASMDWGLPNKHHYAIKTAAALGYIALVGLDRLTVTSICNQSKDGHLPPKRGKKQAHSLFSFLQNLQSDGTGKLYPSLLTYRGSYPQPGPLILLTDLFDPDWKMALQILAAGRYEITLLHLLSPEEIDPKYSGDLKLLDAETNAEVEITADFDLVQRYKDNLIRWREDVAQYCSNRGIQYIPLSTALTFENLLFSILRRHAILK